MKKRIFTVAASLLVICTSLNAQSVATDKPIADNPIADNPIADKPIADNPISEKTTDVTTEEATDSIDHEDVIVQPEYPGGIEKLYDFIIANFEYPEDCKKRNVRGTVEMEFTIEKSGDISAVGILKGLDPEFDAELIRVFKAMPLWEPATRNGNPVRYKVYMPISLKFSRTNKLGFR